MQRTTRQTIAGSLILIASLFVVYASMLHAGYIWDDDSYLIGNTLIQSLSGLWTLWTVPGAHPQYYPMVFTSYFLEYQLWGLNLAGYHMVNVLLHGLSCLLLWRLLDKLGLRGGWFVAMVFALHPVMVESVAWITERKNVLSLVFYLCGMLAGVRLLDLGYVTKPLKNKAQTLLWWGLLLLCYMLAMLSKTVTVSLPAALLVLVWWKHGAMSRRAVGLMLPLLVIGLALGLHTAHLEKATVGAVGQDWDTTRLQRTLLAGQIVWFYIGKLVHPDPLIFIYHRWEIDTSDLMQWLPVVSLSLIIITLLCIQRKTGRGLLAGLFLFLGTLFPALGFFNVYPMRFSYVADHFQYHASIAMIVLIVCTIASQLHHATLKRLATCAAVLMLLAMGWMTHRQCNTYQNPRILWLDTLDQNPHASIAIYNLGAMAMQDNRPADALAIFNMAVIAYPDHPLPYINRAAAYDVLHQEERKLADISKAITCFRGYEPERGMPHMVLGNVAMKQKDWTQAAGAFEQYVRCLPNSAQGYALLGQCYLEMGQVQRAIEVLSKAIALGDDQPQTWYNLAFACQQSQQIAQAISCYEHVLMLDEKHAEAMSNLAPLLLHETGDFDEAIKLQTMALALKPSQAFRQNLVKTRMGLIMQLIKQNHMADALEQLKLVQQEAKPLEDSALNQRIEKMIEVLNMHDTETGN